MSTSGSLVFGFDGKTCLTGVGYRTGEATFTGLGSGTLIGDGSCSLFSFFYFIFSIIFKSFIVLGDGVCFISIDEGGELGLTGVIILMGSRDGAFRDRSFGDSDKLFDGEDNIGDSGNGTSIFNSTGAGFGLTTFIGFSAAITAIIVLPHINSLTI